MMLREDDEIGDGKRRRESTMKRMFATTVVKAMALYPIVLILISTLCGTLGYVSCVLIYNILSIKQQKINRRQ